MPLSKCLFMDLSRVVLTIRWDDNNDIQNQGGEIKQGACWED